jgi:hypothetical protein
VLLAADATAAVRIEVRDFAMSLPARLPAGRTAFPLDNRGAEPQDGTNEYQERGWFDHGSLGTRPGGPAGGAIDVPPDSEADLGMIYRFAIESCVRTGHIIRP